MSMIVQNHDMLSIKIFRKITDNRPLNVRIIKKYRILSHENNGGADEDRTRDL